MKKYLREIEVSSVLLIIIGFALNFIKGAAMAAWPCGIGLLLFVTVVVYKAFHWREYERENKQYIVIMLLTTIILIAQILLK